METHDTETKMDSTSGPKAPPPDQSTETTATKIPLGQVQEAAPMERHMIVSKLLLDLSEEPSREKLQAFSERHNVHTLALNKDGQLMVTCYKNKRLSLKKGMVSVANILGIAPHNLQRVPTDKKLPDEWVINHMNTDASEDLSPFAFTYGDTFTPKNMKKLRLSQVGNVKGRLKNRLIHESSLKDLVESAIIPYSEVVRIKEAKETMAAVVDMRNADLVDTLTHTFQHMVEDPMTNDVQPSGRYPPVTVHVKGGVPKGRRKNYWVYSDTSSFGKTHFLDFLQKT